MKGKLQQKEIELKDEAEPTVKDKFGVHFEYNDLCRRLNDVLAERGYDPGREVCTEISLEENPEAGRRVHTETAQRKARKSLLVPSKIGFPAKTRTRSSISYANRVIRNKKSSNLKHKIRYGSKKGSKQF